MAHFDAATLGAAEQGLIQVAQLRRRVHHDLRHIRPILVVARRKAHDAVGLEVEAVIDDHVETLGPGVNRIGEIAPTADAREAVLSEEVDDARADEVF